jgi:hypothetical protein
LLAVEEERGIRSTKKAWWYDDIYNNYICVYLWKMYILNDSIQA